MPKSAYARLHPSVHLEKGYIHRLRGLHSSFAATSFKISSVLLPTLARSFATDCQTGECLGSAAVHLSTTSCLRS